MFSDDLFRPAAGDPLPAAAGMEGGLEGPQGKEPQRRGMPGAHAEVARKLSLRLPATQGSGGYVVGVVVWTDAGTSSMPPVPVGASQINSQLAGSAPAGNSESTVKK